MSPSKGLQRIARRFSNFFSWVSNFKQDVIEPELEQEPGPSTFPQFALLPRELRIYIFTLALVPAPSSITVQVCPSHRDGDVRRARTFAPIELSDRELWHLVTVQNRIPDLLFTCKDAFHGGKPYYRQVFCSGFEITDRDLVPFVTYDKNLATVDRGEGHQTSAQHTAKQFLWMGPEDTLIFRYSLRMPPWDGFNPPQSYAMSVYQPFVISGVKYLVMDLYLFYCWTKKSAATGDIEFSGLEILYLVDELVTRLEGTSAALADLLFDGDELRWGIKEVVYLSEMSHLPQEIRAQW